MFLCAHAGVRMHVCACVMFDVLAVDACVCVLMCGCEFVCVCVGVYVVCLSAVVRACVWLCVFV